MSAALRTADAAPASRAARAARRALPAVAWLFAASLHAQTLTAGMATFVGPGWWVRHRDLVHAFEWLSLVAAALAHAGRLPGAVKGLAWATVALLFAQYATAGMRERPGLGVLAALHPVGAMLLFWTSVELARRARAHAPAARLRSR